MALQVDHQHRSPGHLTKRAEQLNNLVVVKMMQEQGTEDEIETARTKRRLESVPSHAQVLAYGKMRGDEIHGGHAGQRIPFPHALRHIPGRGANVKQRKRFLRGSLAFQKPPQGAVPTPMAVDANQVRQAGPSLLVRQRIQQFRLQNAAVQAVDQAPRIQKGRVRVYFTFVMNTNRALSYAVLRITIGCVFFFFGVGKFVNGVAATAHGFEQGFGKTWLPAFSVSAFAMCLPFLEVAIGTLLILGLFTGYALIGTALVITFLTIGVTIQGNPQSVILNLACGIILYVLQSRIEDNRFSLDMFMQRPDR